MKNVRISAMAVLTTAALALTACGGGSSTPGSTDTTGGGGADGKPIVIDMWAGSEDDIAALNAQVDVVKKQNPDGSIPTRRSSSRSPSAHSGRS